MNQLVIDTNFNFHSDSKGGDPDSRSPTLRKYHKLLWSKSLPNGKLFDLKNDKSGTYLYHASESGFFSLGSDAITHSYRNHKRKKWLTTQIQDEVNDLFNTGANIASYLIFPNNRINGNQTINQYRGINRLIDDRFDLTLECIRRFYLGQPSPLEKIISIYKDFFDLFVDFKGYTEFFLLDDLLNNKMEIRFYLPFDDFKSAPVFSNTGDYLSYKKRVLEFNSQRKSRIEKYSKLYLS